MGWREAPRARSEGLIRPYLARVAGPRGNAESKRENWRDARIAAEYDARRFRSPLARVKHRRDLALLCRLLRRAQAQSVLDLPCGTGRMLAPLARRGLRVLGADVSREMMRAGGIIGVQSDATRLPFANGSFDAVVSVRFLFHLTEHERALALAEMARVARCAVIGEMRHRASLKHASRFARSRIGLAQKFKPAPSRASIERELAAAGLVLEVLTPVSRLFSDKSFFLARKPSNLHPR